MADDDQGRIEQLTCWLAGQAGFGSIDEDAIRTSVRRLAYIAGFAWLLTLTSVLFGGISPLAGMSVLTFAGSVLAGGVLLVAKANTELVAAALDVQEADATQAAVEEEDELPVREEPVLPLARSFQPAQIAQERRLLSRGEIEGRAYAIYSDGSIEMDTAFGRRWFASIDLAHEFIGYRPGQAPAQPAAIRPDTALLN